MFNRKKQSSAHTTRNVIIHYHFFKNGGTTFSSILQKTFKRKYSSLESETAVLEQKTISDFVKINRKILAISSHTANLPTPSDPDVNYIPIVFIRHPIDRIGSVYEFERTRTDISPNPSGLIAKQSSIKGFVQWAIEDQTGYSDIVKDFQVKKLAGNKNLEEAVKFLEQVNCLGLVEQFDESLNIFYTHLSPYFKHLRFKKYKIKNQSKGRGNTLEVRLNNLQSSLGQNLWEQLLEANQLDMQLYDIACELFSKRKDSIFG